MAGLTRSPSQFEANLVDHPAVQRALDDLAADLRDETERLIVQRAYDTGRLSRAVTVQRSAEGVRAVRSSAGVDEPDMLPRWISHGTGIYGPRRQVIRPKKAKALRFVPKGGGGVVYAKSVKGVRPREYMRDAAIYTAERHRLRYVSLR